jgi:hypothetical protein
MIEIENWRTIRADFTLNGIRQISEAKEAN